MLLAALYTLTPANIGPKTIGTTSMATQHQRQSFVLTLNKMDTAWVSFLNDKDFYDINYSDLFTGLWLSDKPVRKQEAVMFMRHLGAQTAKKYLNHAIEKGLIVEIPDPDDGRAKRIGLSPSLKSGLEQFFDHAIKLFKEGLSP
jgi:DNA-binding MarR family transcriptional regulator